MRPNSTVPNTTSSRPDTAASTRAHARWNSVAGLTPSRLRRLPQPAGQAGSSSSRASRRRHPVAVHVGQPERRRRLGDVGQQAGEVPLVLLAAGRRRGPGRRSRGTAAGPAAGPPPRQQDRRSSREQRPPGRCGRGSCGGSAQRQPAAPVPGLAARCRSQQRRPVQVHPRPAAASRRPPASAVAPVQRDLGHRQLGVPPDDLDRLGAGPARPSRCGRCRAGRRPAAARPRNSSSRSRESNARTVGAA